VIDYLEKRKADNRNMGLAFVYCDYRDQVQQTTENIIGAILKKLLTQLPSILPEVVEIWKKHSNGRQRLGLFQTVEALCNVCKLFTTVFLCVDALDECADMLTLLTSLQHAASKVHLFTTGRKHVRDIVRQCFKNTKMIHIEAKISDIQILIKKRIDEDRTKDPSLMNEALEHDITEKISAFSNGMLV